jgi:hypothetical protein
MNFTIFLNSRGRVGQLNRCLFAIQQNTKDITNLELIVKADLDDRETIDYMKNVIGSEVDNKPQIGSISLSVGERPTSLCASFNMMANIAQGRYLFVLTDDAEIMTKDWDEIALNKIAEFKHANNIKDDIIYGRTSDTSIDKVKGEDYASFPIISKQAVNVLGFFMYESFVGLGGDSSIYRVYRGINRVVSLDEIKLDHVYNNTIFKVMTPDLTGHEMRQRTAASPLNPFTFNVDNEVNKLKNFIDNYKPNYN